MLFRFTRVRLFVDRALATPNVCNVRFTVLTLGSKQVEVLTSKAIFRYRCVLPIGTVVQGHRARQYAQPFQDAQRYTRVVVGRCVTTVFRNCNVHTQVVVKGVRRDSFTPYFAIIATP